MAEAIERVSAEIACPTTGEPCPARVHLVGLYRQEDQDPNAVFDMDYDDPMHPRFDEMKLQIKLTEHSIQATARDCDGPVENQCLPREAMDNSRTRQGLVSVVRALIRQVSINK